MRYILALLLTLSTAQASSQAIIYKAKVPPVPYAHLDFSRAVNPQYDIYMTLMESMTPKGVARYMFQEHRPRAVKPVEASAPGQLDYASKLVATTLAALLASFGALWYIIKKERQ